MVTQHTLERLAAKYIWWKTPQEAAKNPARVVAQVMNIGDYGDVQQLVDEAGEACLRDVLTHAEAGQFDARSWAYWHYRLKLVPANAAVPELPERKIA